ncbi:cilia- and flagella-associated protein 20-like [Archocentrus centrarchus]|uniref:cilia- and flagella-associated protein 20-like n=1 Tax=Archocentrus centrarchus TaxID=63155 RepID=UPI0011E9FBE7|nr:cilia- and flagella-associated protein 20-like [Archocentrus centrarchus]
MCENASVFSTILSSIDSKPLAMWDKKVLDDQNIHRRFRVSNYQSTTKVNPFVCTMPMRLDDGWNQIQFNLSELTRRSYGTNYTEMLHVHVSAQMRNLLSLGAAWTGVTLRSL